MSQVKFPAVFTAGETCFIYGDDFEKKYGSVPSGASVVIVNSATLSADDSTIYQLAWSMKTGYTDNFWLYESEIAASNGTIREATDEDLASFGVLEEAENTSTCRVLKKGTRLLYGPDDKFYSAGRVNPSKPLLILATYPGYFFVKKESGPDDVNGNSLTGFVKVEDVEVELDVDEMTEDEIEAIKAASINTVPVEEVVAAAEEPVEEVEDEPEPKNGPIPTVPVADGLVRPASPIKMSRLIPSASNIDYSKCAVLSFVCDETRAESIEQKLAMINAADNSVKRFITRGDVKGYSDVDVHGYHNLPTDYQDRVYAVVEAEVASAIKKKMLAQGFRPTLHQYE